VCAFCERRWEKQAGAAPLASELAAGPAARRRWTARLLRAGALTPLLPRAQVGEGNQEWRVLRARRQRRVRLLRARTLTVLLLRAQVGEGNLERRALRAEKLAMREMLYPVLQAEEDRRRGAAC